MEIILVLEIVLFAAAIAALQRALRRRVEEAARWEASVAAEMNRSARAVMPLLRVAPHDVTAMECFARDSDYDNDRVRPVIL